MRPTIIHIITDLASGGAESSLTRLVLADRDPGSARHVVVSLSGDGVYARERQSAGVETHDLNLNGFLRLPVAFFRLVRLMRKIRPHVIMTWLYHADFLGTLAALVRGQGTDRLIWNLRCSNVDFSNYAVTTSWIVRILARMSQLPKVVAVNSRSGQQAHYALGYRPQHWAYVPNGIDLREWHADKKIG